MNDERSGVGIFYDKNGTIFMGEYMRGKRQGFAIEKNLESKYEGTCINNWLSGKGILTHNNGSKYVG